ncbi:MAG: Trk system potassium transporter TrkA [Lachnospiraceae bacterium]|nr:Trk system potassium transporter TrkA [Lachnospiraceae bacterium]
MKPIFPKVNTGLNIVIVGGGKIGVALIEQLTAEGHDITIIDNNPVRIQTITDMYDIMGIAGNGASYGIQMEAGIENADLIIAVTGSDELNLLCCTVASQVGNCASIARVRTPDYSKEAGYLIKKLGLAMIINPELEAAKEVARIISLPIALDVTTFTHGQADLVKVKVTSNSPLDNMMISDIAHNISNDFLIGAVERDNEIFIPSGNFTIKSNDKISIVAARKDIHNTLKKLGFKTTTVKNCMIIGGGKVAYYLASQLLSAGVAVKIIEQSKKRCEQLSILLPKAVIINGDGTDAGLLDEEDLPGVDSFVPLTGIDEENIMLTLHAKQVSNAKVITKINRLGFKDVINTLDLGSVVYPRFITAEAIIAYVRALSNSMNSNVETLYHMFNGRAEAIEFYIKEKSAVTDIPLMNLKLKDNLLICLINRNGRVFIPGGNDSFREGDFVMLVTTHKGFGDIRDILKK